MRVSIVTDVIGADARRPSRRRGRRSRPTGTRMRQPLRLRQLDPVLRGRAGAPHESTTRSRPAPERLGRDLLAGAPASRPRPRCRRRRSSSSSERKGAGELSAFRNASASSRGARGGAGETQTRRVPSSSGLADGAADDAEADDADGERVAREGIPLMRADEAAWYHAAEIANDVSRRASATAARAALPRVRLRRAHRARRHPVPPPLRRPRRPRGGRPAHRVPRLRPRRPLRPRARAASSRAMGAVAGRVRARVRAAARDAAVFAAFIYRFNRPRDLVAFCVAARDLLARHGTLEKCFVAGDADAGRPHRSRARALRARVPRGGRARASSRAAGSRAATGTCSRCPRPAARASGSTCSCAGWSAARRPTSGCGRRVSPARLLMPVDTHIENMSRAIGLTRRRSRNWKMAEEITARLALARPRRSREVRLRALPQAHVGRLPRPPRSPSSARRAACARCAATGGRGGDGRA